MPDSEKDSRSNTADNKAGAAEPVNPEYRKKKEPARTTEEFVDGIRRGDRTSLSRAITLLESSKPEYRNTGRRILEKCLPYTGRSLRIAITGVPGVGKSTFIESLGRHLIDEGRSLAVLAIDPSSSRTRGSILGDKTRMQTLSVDDRAYIRPTPTSGTLGGVARTSRETMLLCEAAGFEIIFIETVGVGQSEILAESMVDYFLLLMLAGAGDELQGIKRGIVEMADLVAVNKAEEKNLQAAKRAKKEYENALNLYPTPPSGRKPSVFLCSALEGTGVKEIWEEVKSALDESKKSGYFDRRRNRQAIHWMHETIHRDLKDTFYRNPEVNQQIATFENRVRSGEISSFKAAEELLELYRKR